ncbi:hypothetical protein Q7267_11095 [Glaesserella parasuis]|uniref:Uncharacterized protein n=3 Tax=Pasteurellaceae TaxID=712 RepID=A0A380U048_9PAST|nr:MULTISPECIES: hypothetical protein [Glaesserella]MCI7353404.1 hypothetical protein [[Actinobacillus] rossii]AUI65597.1 hypothetical protein CJD39_02955 [Glaesserella sp. 15-184]MDG6306463.1 hypothetical protein [Glaesserella parasuis]MDG6429381.1 hypothetical protein [Glaesserella parasuis]MDG6448184.1 hypothetical protein [Glaesserella parasuis]
MNKSSADSLALLFARDILKASNASTASSFLCLDKENANSLADFIETLSSRFESIDDGVSLPMIFNSHKNQSDR